MGGVVRLGVIMDLTDRIESAMTIKARCKLLRLSPVAKWTLALSGTYLLMAAIVGVTNGG